MDGISFRPQPLLAHWAPGAILTCIAAFYVIDSKGVRWIWRISSGIGTTLLIVLLALISFGLGQVLDAIRDGIFEDVFDSVGKRLPAKGRFSATLRGLGFKEVNWDFFVRGEPRILENFEVWFYSHYMLGFDLGLGLLLLLLPWWKLLPDARPQVPAAFSCGLFVAGILLLYDVLRLRSHIADITNELCPARAKVDGDASRA
jgi:hypothetical protein